jgi:hypothetical protein
MTSTVESATLRLNLGVRADSPGCNDVRPSLGSFVDGELTGADRLLVSEHLEHCVPCSEHVAWMRDVGSLLRDVADTPVMPPALDGLAGGVVSRTRAERAQSWRGVLSRALDDWHWVLVGAGSVTASFATTLFVSALLTFGPLPERNDSLSALITNLGTPVGSLFVYATPAGSNLDSMLLQVDDSESSRFTAALASYDAPTQADLVDALTDTVTHDGRLLDLSRMHPDTRRYAEALLDQIKSVRMLGPLPTGAAVNVHEVRLVTSTGVTAKGL